MRGSTRTTGPLEMFIKLGLARGAVLDENNETNDADVVARYTNSIEHNCVT